MSTVEGEDAATFAAAPPPKVRRRRILVSLSVAGTLRYLVTPQIVEKFEAIAAALKRLPGP